MQTDAITYLRSLVRIGGIDSAAHILNVTPEQLAVYLRSLES